MIDQGLLNAEMAVIGAAIIDREALHYILSNIVTDDFEDPRCQAIYDAILTNVNKKVTVSLPTIVEELKNMKRVKEMGSTEFLSNCLDAIPAVEDHKDYVNIVKDKSLARHFFDAIHQIEIDYSTKKVDDIPNFIGDAEKKIVEITKKRRVADFRGIKSVIDSVLINIDDRAKIREANKGKRPDYLTGTSTGFQDIDFKLGGFQRGDLIILAARPSVGKTALALNFASKAAHQGFPVGIFSLEMSAEQIALRLISERARISTSDISKIRLNNDQTGFDESFVLVDSVTKKKVDIYSLNQAMMELAREHIYIDDSSGTRINDIEAKAKKLKNNVENLGLIIIDYIGLINTSNRSSRGDRQQEISEISRNLKGLAKELQVPILVLSQLSRGVENRTDHEPQLSDLRDSGAIEQDADQVFFIYRPDYYKEKDKKKTGSDSPVLAPLATSSESEQIKDPSETKLILRKNRNGQLAEFTFLFFKRFCHFEITTTEFDNDPNNR